MSTSPEKGWGQSESYRIVAEVCSYQLFISALGKKSNPVARIQLKILKQLFGLKDDITYFLFSGYVWSFAEPL